MYFLDFSSTTKKLKDMESIHLLKWFWSLKGLIYSWTLILYLQQVGNTFKGLAELGTKEEWSRSEIFENPLYTAYNALWW